MNPHERQRDDAEQWELAAAELTAALHNASASLAINHLPDALAERIVRRGEHAVRQRALRRARWYWTGSLAVAAAIVFLMVTSHRSVANTTHVAQLRDSLLVHDANVSTLSWTPTTDSSALGAAGDVVWSARAQAGVMRLAGLRPNDRAQWQYQLWIFEKRRDARYPVDGGVFDIPVGSSDVLVPISARVRIDDAVMFAITVERAGGVVVSTRERVALLAKRNG